MAELTGLLQYTFVVPATATVVGWFVVARQTDRREFRKEVRDHLKELKESIEQVRQRSAAYWLEGDLQKASIAAIGLKSEEQRLGRITRTLVACGLDFDDAARRSEIRQFATGGDFESKSRVRSEADEDRLKDIAGCLEDLLSEVEVSFYRKFKHPRPARWIKWVPFVALLFLTDDVN